MGILEKGLSKYVLGGMYLLSFKNNKYLLINKYTHRLEEKWSRVNWKI